MNHDVHDVGFSGSPGKAARWDSTLGAHAAMLSPDRQHLLLILSKGREEDFVRVKIDPVR